MTTENIDIQHNISNIKPINPNRQSPAPQIQPSVNTDSGDKKVAGAVLATALAATVLGGVVLHKKTKGFEKPLKEEIPKRP